MYHRLPRPRRDTRSIEVLTYFLQTLEGGSEASCQRILDVAAEILKRTQSHGFPTEFVALYQNEAHSQIGWRQMKFGRVDSGESHLRRAIDIGVAAYGARDVNVQGDQLSLQRWLRRWGRTEAADLVERQRRAAVEVEAESDDEAAT